MKAGDKHYRAWIGPPQFYDLKSSSQFTLLTSFLNMRETSKLLDIGCGSLRLGRLAIVYLKQGHYFGVEPEEWLVKDGIKSELGQEIITMKQPHITHTREFDFTSFGEKFDYIIAQSIFSHAALWQIKKCMKNAKNVLEPNGRFVFNYGVGKQDYTGNDWVYPGCVSYTPKTMHQVAEDLNLHWAEIEIPISFSKHWMVVAKNKTALNICQNFLKGDK